MARKHINIKALYDLRAFSDSSQNLAREMRKSGRQLQSVGESMSKALTLPILAFGAIAVKTAADFESLKTSLKTSLDGSASAASAAFKQIEGFASSTPYALAEVTQGFIKLKNMGLDPSMDALKSYGNTASAMGKSLNDMVEAVADAAVGEFERLKEFGIKAKSEGDNVSFTFKGITTTIGKNSKEIEQYLQNIGNTSFAGGIEEQSKTFNGVLSTLKDNMALAAASFGELMLPTLKKIAGAFQVVAGFIRSLSPTVKKMVMAFAGLLAIGGPLLMLIGAISVGMGAIAGAIGVATWPIYAVVAALGVLTATFIYVKDNLGAFADHFLYEWNSTKNDFIDIMKAMVQPFLKAMKLMGQEVQSNNIAMWLDSMKTPLNENRRAFTSFRETATKAVSDVTGSVTKVEKGIDKATESQKKFVAGSKDVATKVVDAWNGVGLVLGSVGRTFTAMDSVFRPTKLDIQPLTDEELGLEGIASTAQTIGMQAGEELSRGLKDAATSGLTMFGEFMGNVLSGGDMTVKDFGAGMLDMVGSFMQQFGQAMIAIGIAEAMIDASIKSMNPVLAIAGGVALVAAGAALSNLSKKGISGSGGGGDHSTPSYGGGGGNNYNSGNIVMDTQISGRNLILVQQRESQFSR